MLLLSNKCIGWYSNNNLITINSYNILVLLVFIILSGLHKLKIYSTYKWVK